MRNATVCAAFDVLHTAAHAQKRRQNRFCKIEPSLVTDSSEAFKDGREASDDSTDVGGAWSAEPAAALCLRLVARARCGQPHETRK
jgi:type II secretory pathway component GspD/PulD (secretin)